MKCQDTGGIGNCSVWETREDTAKALPPPDPCSQGYPRCLDMQPIHFGERRNAKAVVHGATAAPGTFLPAGGCIQPRHGKDPCHNHHPMHCESLGAESEGAATRLLLPTPRLPQSQVFLGAQGTAQPPQGMLLGTITPALPGANTSLVPKPLAQCCAQGWPQCDSVCCSPSLTNSPICSCFGFRYHGLSLLYPLKIPMESPLHLPQSNPAAPTTPCSTRPCHPARKVTVVWLSTLTLFRAGNHALGTPQ